MAGDPITALSSAFDGNVGRAGAFVRRHRALFAAIVLPGCVALIGFAFIPVRSSIGSQNVALVLAAATIAVALGAGAVPAILSGLAAAAVFAVFHTEPYGELDITARHDEITTILLVGFASALALVRRRLLQLNEHGRRQEVDLRLLSVGARDLLSAHGSGRSLAGLDSSLQAMADVLHARTCEIGPVPGGEVPRLGTNTLIAGGAGPSEGELPVLAVDLSATESLILREVDLERIDVSDRLAALGLAALIAAR
ncbi:MAG: DUF4118 domain-containing protein [Acidimicrobiales bacterium]